MTCCATLMRVFSVFSNFQLSIPFSRGGPMLTRVVLPKELLTLVKIRPTVSLVKIRLLFLFLPQGILNGCCHPYGRQLLYIMEIPQPTLLSGVMFR